MLQMNLSEKDKNLIKSIEIKEERVKQGFFSTRPPYGYRIRAKKLEIVKEEADIVRQIFDDYIDGLKIRELARKHEVNPMKIKRILENPVYIGKIRWKGELISGNHPIILSSDVFQKVQEVKKRKKIEEG